MAQTACTIPCNDESLDVAAKMLCDGKVAVIPTDTVYGLAAHPAHPEAVERLYTMKAREARKPIALLASDEDALKRNGFALEAEAADLAKRYWPGALTLVVENKEGRTEGFRVPAHDWTRKLIARCGGLLRVTSANISGEAPAKDAAEAFRALGLAPDAIFDGGKSKVGIASTVVKVAANGALSILRKGAIALALTLLASFSFAAMPKVPVIAHEPGYYTSLAKHSARWLVSEDIDAAVVDVKDMHAALEKAPIALLIGFDAPTAAEIAELKAFRSRGGKLVVFYSSSPALAALVGVKVNGYRKAPYPGAWSRMDFKSKFPEGLPVAIRQTSTVLQSAHPLPDKGRILAEWVDRNGKPSGEAAWIASHGGYWMTHVLLGDGDEDLKARLLASLAGSVDPRIWNAKKAGEKAGARIWKLRKFASAQSPRQGELHAVWDHSGCGLYPGNWKRTIELLRISGVTDLFVNVAGASFAHYPSKVLPASRTFTDEGDQLKACIEAARGSGVRVHAWILCFNATRGSPETLDAFAKKGWRLKNKEGRLTEYLDPSKAAVQERILKAIDEIQANYQVAGIHLDFVRWYEGSNKPKDAAAVISKFVAKARRRIGRGRWLTAAVLGKYPMCIASVGQDWESWLNANLVDYVVPMDYTENMEKFESFLVQHSSSPKRSSRIIAGIGVTANESRLDAQKVIEQINLVRKHNLAGVALFDLDVTLEKQILPYLRLGMWKKK